MIDVRSRRCAATGCKRQPSYGFEGKRACYCAAHKLEGQVDVVSRRCEEPGCRRRPLYGYEVKGAYVSACHAHGKGGGRGARSRGHVALSTSLFSFPTKQTPQPSATRPHVGVWIGIDKTRPKELNCLMSHNSQAAWRSEWHGRRPGLVRSALQPSPPPEHLALRVIGVVGRRRL